jgi:hypothetical protein
MDESGNQNGYPNQLIQKHLFFYFIFSREVLIPLIKAELKP